MSERQIQEEYDEEDAILEESEEKKEQESSAEVILNEEEKEWVKNYNIKKKRPTLEELKQDHYTLESIYSQAQKCIDN